MFNKKIGILGGGQLGKMLFQEGSKLNLNIHILDKDKNFPAASICPNFQCGDFSIYEDVMEFGSEMDILTVEIESVHEGALAELQKKGISVYPDPRILGIIKDKGIQKQFLYASDLPTSPFRLFNSKKDVINALHANEFRYPFVQKIRKGGYDGRGVSIIHTKDDLENLLEGPSLIEEKIQIQKELSVIIARNTKGEISCYRSSEMVFSTAANLLDYQISPSQIDPKTEMECQKLAHIIVNKLNHVGLMAVEMFLDLENQIWVNELAPRPHNSGHHTIEANVTSQYEQHLRSILELSLGNTEQLFPSILLNLLGAEGFSGPVKYDGIRKCLELQDVFFHIYGKPMSKPYRKMGHATIMAQDFDVAMSKLKFIKENLNIRT